MVATRRLTRRCGEPSARRRRAGSRARSVRAYSPNRGSRHTRPSGRPRALGACSGSQRCNCSRTGGRRRSLRCRSSSVPPRPRGGGDPEARSQPPVGACCPGCSGSLAETQQGGIARVRVGPPASPVSMTTASRGRRISRRGRLSLASGWGLRQAVCSGTISCADGVGTTRSSAHDCSVESATLPSFRRRAANGSPACFSSSSSSSFSGPPCSRRRAGSRRRPAKPSRRPPVAS